MQESARHVLLRKGGVTRPISSLTLPQGAAYSLVVGAWILPDGTLVVESPTKPIQGTKKADVEKGEDQKGY